MKVILSLLVLITITSCCSDHDKGLFYVIKHVELSHKDSIGYLGPVFYSFDNFILYNDSTVYYHKMNPSVCGRCGTGLDPTKPPFINLQPSDLKVIQLKDLDLFWKKHIESSLKRNRHLTISSPTDTIYNLAILKLKKLSGFSEKIMLNIRNCTEEQLFVAEAKFKKKSYSTQKYEWKIGFDDGQLPHEQVILRFLPPVGN